jgi:hypothetical protein
VIPSFTMRRSLADKRLLGDVISGDSWLPWRILLIAACGEELTDSEREIFTSLTGRAHEPGEMCEELVGCIGRRGGKSRAISVLVTWISGLCRHPKLVVGEKGCALVISQDQRQADIVLDYVASNFEQSPILKQLVESRTARTLRLTNNVIVEVRASDFRSLRGPSYICAVADEVAFWMTGDSSNPDVEILNSVRPGLSTTGGPLIMISSPYARKGELWSSYDRHFGQKGDPKILVARAASRTMNSTLPQSVVDRAMEKDPAMASAEWLANFRTDIESFVSLDAVRRCISVGTFERPPDRSQAFVAFVDPSGGQHDSMTLCIAHQDFSKEIIVVDCLREIRAPFSSEFACHEFANVLKSYGLSTCFGDGYGKVWVVEQFSRFGVS